MLRVGLTGGIATGKSYVRTRFEALGVPTIDADVLARRVVEPGTDGLLAVVARFGPGILDGEERLDRARLGEIAFRDTSARRDLEAIIHPRVFAAVQAWFEALEQDGRTPLGVADIPLLFETGRAGDFDAVVVTACPPHVQVARVRARDGLSEEAARRRLAAQWPIEEKARQADIVIHTDGSFEDTDAQIARALESLRQRARMLGPA